MNSAVWGALFTAVVTVVVTAGGWIVERRKRKAEADKLAAEAASVQRVAESTVMDAVARAVAAIQDQYQELIADLVARSNAISQEAVTARMAARAAQEAAAESETQAWRAEQHARAMARFLHELRPVIAAHVPEAEAAPLLERMDRLTQLI